MDEELLIKDEELNAEECVSPKAIPLAGWLILLGIGITINPFMIAFAIYQNHVPLIFGGRMALMDSYLRNIVYFEFTMNSISLILSVVVLFAYYTKKRWFKKAWFILMSSILFATIVDYIALKHSIVGTPEVLPILLSAIVKTSISFAIWGLYLLKSKRAAETFVN